MREAAIAPCLTASAACPKDAELSGSRSAICGVCPPLCGVVIASGGSAIASGKVFATGASVSGVGAAAAAAGEGFARGAMARASLTGAGLVAVAHPPARVARNRMSRKVAIRCIRKITRQIKTYYM